MTDAWTGKPASKGLLHQRQVESYIHRFKMQNVDRPESFVHQTYTRKPLGARRSVLSGAGLRRTAFSGAGAGRGEENNFGFVLAGAVVAMFIFAAVKEAPVLYSAASHTLHSKALIHEMHELRALI